MSISKAGEVATPARRYRFGSRWLLVVVLVFAIPCSWFGSQLLQVTRQMRGIRDLAQFDLRVREREPTGLGLLVKKFIGQNEDRIRGRIDENWFSRPSILVSWTMTDEQVPEVAKQINAIGGISELHVETSPLTEPGLAALKNVLPKVAVLTRTELINRQRPGEQFATAALQYAATVAAGVIAVLIVLLWPFRRRRKKQFSPQGMP